MNIKVRTDEGWQEIKCDRLYATKNGNEIAGILEYKGQVMMCVKDEPGFDKLMDIMQKDEIGCEVKLKGDN